MTKHHLKSALIVCSLYLLTACQKSELNDLEEAQLCLNTASASAARACVSSLASNSSQRANSLKCASIFISEGFGTPVSFINALDSLNSTGSCTGGCSSTVNAIKTFNFTGAGVSNTTQLDTNVATANEAFDVCSASGVNIYTQISSLFKIGTLTAKLAYALNGGSTLTEDQIKAQINNVSSVDLGNLVTTTYNGTCTDTSKASDSTKKYCAELASALGSYTSPTDIGNCLKIKLNNPNAACP